MKDYFKTKLGIFSIEVLGVILTTFLIVDFILIATYVSAPLSFVLMLVILCLWVFGYSCLQGSKDTWICKVAKPAINDVFDIKGSNVLQKSFQANLINTYKLVPKNIICKDTKGCIKKEVNGNTIAFGDVLLLDGVTTKNMIAYRMKCRTGVFKSIYISNIDGFKSMDHKNIYETTVKKFDRDFISIVPNEVDAKSFLSKKNIATFNKLNENGVKFTLYVDSKQIIVLRDGSIIRDDLPTYEEYVEILKEYNDFCLTIANLFHAKKS